MKSIIPPVSTQLLVEEIATIPRDCLMVERGKFQVYIVQTKAIPNLLREIGRLREITFRAVGEGTGNAIDIDEFDNYYYNLFIWDKQAQCIVGGYRVGLGDEIFKNIGIEGFYINSLFRIKSPAYAILQNSLELGRSYITKAYQKGYLPLFLLWQGILSFLIKNPRYQYLIGPVSISKYYSDISKNMIVEFVKANYYDEEIAQYFQPRTPFQPNLPEQAVPPVRTAIKDLERFLAKIEPEHIKVPVLIKQYIKLNARFISFNLDPNFSNALDGLMLLNLKHLPQEILTLLQEK